MSSMLLPACRRSLTLRRVNFNRVSAPPPVRTPGRPHDQVSPRVRLATRFLAALPMTMPTTSMTTLEMISEDTQASRASLRLLSSLMAAGGLAVAVLMVPPAPPAKTPPVIPA